MLRVLLDQRTLVAGLLALGVGVLGVQAHPLDRGNVYLQLIELRNPTAFLVLGYGYATLWFTTPFFAASLLTSLVTVVAYRHPLGARSRSLPAYVPPEHRPTPMLVLGETHFETTTGRAPQPSWLTIPQRGLYTGVMILGAVGTGKTSACMYPYTEQLLRWRAGDPDRKIGGLVLEELLESGHVLALNFPVGLNPGLARALGVMLKLDFQRAVLQRIPKIAAHPERIWRDLLFVCDEYHAFATVGETDPTGDERTFALSRQARLIPIVATQSVSSLRSALPADESWRTLLQCFRTKVFLATSDEFTARAAADLCGRRDRLKAHYTLSEGGQGAHISLLTGRATAARHTVSASKSYAPHHEYIFSPRVFTELQNAQAIVLPYDGLNPMPPQFCYLKPHYLDVQTCYFDHLSRGVL